MEKAEIVWRERHAETQTGQFLLANTQPGRPSLRWELTLGGGGEQLKNAGIRLGGFSLGFRQREGESSRGGKGNEEAEGGA